MWEFWRSKWSKKPSRRARGSESDSPFSSRSNDHAFSPELAAYNAPEHSKHIYFKDLKLPATDDSEEEDMHKHVARQKLVIVLVGLPGRGKTFLCNKLLCYLNWLGHETRHFNVGQYRRKLKQHNEVQDAQFFDRSNPAGLAARQEALLAALDAMLNWLDEEQSQVAIFDATNSTEERRNFLRSKLHGRFEYLFIESICNDPQVLEQNYMQKMVYSPDYLGVDKYQALEDFKARIAKYEEVYETITNRDLHYIKLIDMVTGRGYMDVNRISGYIPGKIVFFLMQVCKAGVARVRRIWLTRHGESEWNLQGKLGGNSNLSARGKLYARLLPDILIDRVPLTFDGAPMPVSVWTSTLKRTIQTAEFIPFPKLRWKVLDEIQAGVCEGMTYAEIEASMPEEFAARKVDKLRYRYPCGESYMDVIQRLESAVVEMERERECVCVVAHQAVLRAVYGYFTKAPPEDIPRLEVPLHTLIELTPKPDGTMHEERFYVDVDEFKESLSRGMSSRADMDHVTSFGDLRGLGIPEEQDPHTSERSSASMQRPLPTDNTDI